MENRSKGIMLILLSSLFFALMAATVKFLDNIPTPEKIFFRNLLGLFVAIYIIKKKNKSLIGNNKKLLILRSILGLSGVAAYFYSLSVLPLADTVILNKISPFFVLILSFVFLKEKISKFQIISLIVAIIGAGFVIKPEFNVEIIPYLIALASAFFAGSAYTVIRHLRNYDSTETIIFYFTLFSTITMIPFMIFGGFVIPSILELLGLLLLGVFATSAQFLMTNAYRYAPAGELAIYTYANIIFSTLIGLLIFFEVPDYLSVIGGLLIISAGFINYYKKNKPL